MSRTAPARQRFPDWPERLAAILEERLDRPFYYGAQDCGLFAADVAVALTGEDPAAWLRGAYNTADELDVLLREAGGFEAAMARTLAEFGAPECPPAFAARGDCALVQIGNQQMVGVIVGDRIAVTGLDGLQYVPLRMATRAWAI